MSSGSAIIIITMSVYFYSHYTIILEICSVVVILASSRCNVMKYTGSVFYLCIIHGTTYMYTGHWWPCIWCAWVASSPGHSQILSRSHVCEIKSGSGLGLCMSPLCSPMTLYTASWGCERLRTGQYTSVISWAIIMQFGWLYIFDPKGLINYTYTLNVFMNMQNHYTCALYTKKRLLLKKCGVEMRWN